MIKKITFLILVTTCFFPKAQSVFAPIGSTWNYTWYEHSGAYTGPKTLFYKGDTLISTITYKKIAAAYSYSCICPNPQIGSYYYDYIYERNDSVFQAFPGGSQPMVLLYSFNQPIGDSIIFNPGSPSFRYKLVLDSLKTQFICNQNRRVLFYSKYENGCTDSVRVIEGIGPVNDYLFSQGIGNCELGLGSYVFNCANITTCIYPSGNCQSVPLSVSETNTNFTFNVISLHKELIFSFAEKLTGEIKLLDVQGKNILSEKINATKEFNISTSDLKTGIYFVCVKSNKGEFYRKIIIE